MFLSQWSSTSGKLHFWCHRIGTDTFLLAHTLEARLSFVLLLEALDQVWVHSFWCMKVHSAVCTMYNWPVQEQHADSNLKLSFAISCPNVYSRVISKREMNRKLKKRFEVKSRLQAKLNSANVLNSAQCNPPQCNPS